MPRIARALPYFLACALGVAAPARAMDAGKAPVLDCPEAKQLPPEANDESRRVTCEIPAQYRMDVTLAAFFGRQMRLHDIAAWLTTDALVEAGAFKDIGGKGQGWLTREHDGRIEVRYFREADGQVAAFAAADLDLESIKAANARRLDPAEPATAQELLLLRARSLALEGEALRCSEKVNTIILQGDVQDRKEIRVYVMSAWSGEHLVFGGHQLVTLAGDGSAVTGRYEHTRGCLNFEPAPPDREGFVSEGPFVSHLTSATPNEFHVFLSLQHRQPVLVSTQDNGLLWRVDGTRISLESGELKDKVDESLRGSEQAPPKDRQ